MALVLSGTVIILFICSSHLLHLLLYKILYIKCDMERSEGMYPSSNIEGSIKTA